MINIEQHPYSVIEFYAGTYIAKHQWEDEIDTLMEYPFTIQSVWSHNIPQSEEVLWPVGKPVNYKKAEEQIMAEFLKIELGVDVGVK